MRVAFLVQLLLALLAAGCASSAFFLTPRLAPAVTDAKLDFEISDFSARTNKGVLEIVARAAHADTDYRESFELELANATAICAALANSTAAFRYDWQVMELTFWSEYGNMLRWRNSVGFLMIRMRRDTLNMLRKENVPASEYPKHWQLVAGSKAGPDQQILEWGAGEPEPRPDQPIEHSP